MTTSSDNHTLLEKIVSLAKRRGFFYQGSEIYGGLAGTYDAGPLGVALKKNIEQLWWRRFVDNRDDMYGVDAAIMMNPRVWEAVGHVEGFHDPLVTDTKTNKRYRADHLLEEAGVDVVGMTIKEMTKALEEHKVMSPDGNPLSKPEQFNMMFKTFMGPSSSEEYQDESPEFDSDGTVVGVSPERHLIEYDPFSLVYLRPETAQGMFVNFKNIVDSFHPKLPFGMAQIGKAFRNEINPRDFLFRVREFEQMEIEYFVREREWKASFEYWREQMWAWIEEIGLSRDTVHEVEVGEEDRAHYSTRTIDFEFDYPFGRKELYGLAYRTDFDLTNHSKASGVSLTYFDQEAGERFVPHVIEPTFGMGRTILALLTNAYREDTMDEEVRTYLAFKPAVAPVKVAVFPLLKNKPALVEKAREVFAAIKKEIPAVMFDDNGNIGKRYRRQDEIGTPLCVTIDFDTLEGDTVTLRDRDTGEQRRVPLGDLMQALHEVLS